MSISIVINNIVENLKKDIMVDSRISRICSIGDGLKVLLAISIYKIYKLTKIGNSRG